MTGNEIRQKFLDFFKGKKHTIVESDSLVPKDDPTVLFTTAGMQQFKRQFLGHIGDYTRAASSQKCLRTDDLDEVGQTDFHHTFFEMLGNFSFGDYFKEEAITWAWEFLTQDLGIAPDKLWASIYKDDKEAEDIWRNTIGIDPKKLVKLGDKSNFWPANAKQNGPNGPCGPCSEIFYDYGKGGKKCTRKPCDPDCGCGRFSEIWNLVFTQFNRKEGGVLEPLPNKNIDTGMGLERLVAVMQGKKSNYQTDLFVPILDAIDKMTWNNPLEIKDRFIIADHIRAIVFAINDGVYPSNKDRGYVVKKLIYESTDRIIRRNNVTNPLSQLVPFVIDVMQDAYPDLIKNERTITEYIKKTENAYIHLLNERIPMLQKEILHIKNRQDLDENVKILRWGRLMFHYRDTYGLTLESIRDAFSAGNVDKKTQIPINEEFNRLMSGQIKRSRASSKMTGDVFTDADLDLDVAKTKFTGYDKSEGSGTILKLFIGDKPVKEASQGDQVKVILDTTPFYAEAGGQIGDTGFITAKEGRIRIEDTQKIDDVYIHFGKVEQGLIKANDSVKTAIDLERRLSIMRHHTATHLLQAALREILGDHVQQQGSLVAEDRLRFDFTHPKAVSKKELAQIETRINEYVKRNDKVYKEEMPLAEAKKKGALAFFAEKYKDRVRVISIGDYSKEFCGGTHLDETGEIKQLVISAEGAVAQGIRRLEAKTADFAAEFIKEREVKSAKLKQTEEKRRQDLQKKKEGDKRRLEAFKNDLKTIIDKAETVNRTKIVTKAFTDSDANQLKVFFDLIRQQAPSVIACLGSAVNGSAAVIVGVSGDLVKKGVKANELIKDIAGLINGSGGGRPELAQAGSKETGQLDHALQQANKLIKDKVNL